MFVFGGGGAWSELVYVFEVLLLIFQEIFKLIVCRDQVVLLSGRAVLIVRGHSKSTHFLFPDSCIEQRGVHLVPLLCIDVSDIVKPILVLPQNLVDIQLLRRRPRLVYLLLVFVVVGYIQVQVLPIQHERFAVGLVPLARVIPEHVVDAVLVEGLRVEPVVARDLHGLADIVEDIVVVLNLIRIQVGVPVRVIRARPLGELECILLVVLDFLRVYDLGLGLISPDECVVDFFLADLVYPLRFL